MLRGPLAIAAATTLGACGSSFDPAEVDALAPHAGAVLEDLIDRSRGPAVAGEALDADRLRRFYAPRGFRPAWATRRAQADALVKAVLNAEEHGLDPDRFHASLLWRRATFPPLHRDLLLSDAFLAYADALAHGAVQAGQRKPFETLSPGRVDVAAALDAAIGRRDPAAAVAALAPATPSYRGLRRALRRQRPGTPAAAIRLRTIEANLERQRWLPRALPPDRVWVNVADQRLVLYRADRPVFTTRVIVGADGERNQSPEFRTLIEASFYNPPWVIPRDIVAAELLPVISRDPTYLTRNRMVLRANGEIEQLPGPDAGLGLLMFDMPNRFDVYLHDTPDKHLFRRDNRRISHGCIRVQNPIELASLLMRQPVAAINARIVAGGTTRNRLPTPVPVFVVYETAFADANGDVQIRPDFYDRDADLWRRLHGQPDGRNPPLMAGGHPPSLRPA